MKPAPENSDWLDPVAIGALDAEALSQLRERLAKSPKELARLEQELELNRLLQDLPDAPLSNNFTSQVMGEISRLEATQARRRSAWSAPLRWMFRPALVTAVTALALTGWWQFRLHERSNLAASVQAVSRAAAVPGVEVFQDFDAIQLLRTSPQPGDVELIAALDTP
jgi:anti-sigma factor RsiW